MKENLTPEQKEIATKSAMITHLEKAICFENTCLSDVRYFEKADMVRIRHKDGFSVCISAEGKSALALLYEIILELKPFLQNALAGTGWKKAFGEAVSFHLRRLAL